jgi:hypothetical protein
METAKKTSKKSANKLSADKLQSAYIEYLLTNGKRPVSVFKFCLDLGIKEDDFYELAGSFDGLERQIWKGFIEDTIGRLNRDDSFSSFDTREKVLAFYYALFEKLRLHRSYILLQLENSRKPELVPQYIKSFKLDFESFLESILNEGRVKGDIANRPVLDKRYPQLFWIHMGFILVFWKDDSSPGFEKTDAAIEKSVNLAFDLIGKGAVDTAIDFAKFLYQNKTR